MDQTTNKNQDNKLPEGVCNAGYVAGRDDIKEIGVEIKHQTDDGPDKSVILGCTAPTKTKMIAFFKKYFWEGQKLRDSVQIESTDSDLPKWKQVVRSRKFWAILMPFIFWEVIWWTLAVRYNLFQYFPDKYKMSITMMFGATVAGKQKLVWSCFLYFFF